MGQLTLLFLGFSNVFHFVCVWPTALKLGCITNFDMLFLVMWFISLVVYVEKKGKGLSPPPLRHF